MRKYIGAAVFILSMSSSAWATDFQWSGEYRIEGNYIKNFTLSNSQGVEDSYLTNHLVLFPKIVAADGLNIKARFDVFNNALGNNQIGQVMGDYVGVPGPAGNTTQPPAVLSNTEQQETIAVNALYLTWINEFGGLVAGRVPFQFGLGMTYSDGSGVFDHYFSTKDIISYKLVLGNFTITPAYGKVREGILTNEDDINDYMMSAEYKNNESDMSMGVIFDERVAPYDTTDGNDFPTDLFSNQGTANVYDGYNAYTMNFYFKKKFDAFKMGIEAGFSNGYTGIQILSGGNYERVNLAGFGVASEFNYHTGDWDFNLRAGLASGDDPSTPTYEGYFFNPNYDVAMLMFNYPVGQYDVLGSGIMGTHPSTSTNTSVQAMNGLDTEVITNAFYIAPNVKWAMAEKFDILGTIAYGQVLQPTPGAGSDLGFEVDVGLNFHPLDKFQWLTTAGVLMPGNAFAGSSTQNYATDMAYGVTSKAAVSF